MEIGNMCTSSGILTVFLILKYALSIICTIVPIIVMIRAVMILYPVVMSGEKINEKFAMIVKSTIAAIVVFMLPSMFRFVFTSIVDLSHTDIGLCFTNATAENIDRFKVEEEAKRQAEKDKNLHDHIEASKKKKEEEEKKNSQLEENDRPQDNNSQNNGQVGNTNPAGYGSLFVGDSRTAGYSYQLSLRETDHIYATSGGAMAAFQTDVNKAIEQINSDPSHRYNLVLNYGVNNMSQDWVGAYKNVINRLNGKANILIVSVNPCNDSIAKYCRNANVETFNNKLKTEFSSGYDNVKYCDTYTPFVNTANYTSMIETSEGIHYTNQGANFIYQKINECLNSF